jgi:hypothetical protein
MNHHKLHGLCTFHVQPPRVRVCACASACVVKRSLIFGRILSKFTVTILGITTSCVGYVFVISTDRARVCERACASARVVKHSLIFGRILSKFGKNILRGHNLHGLCTYIACACASVHVLTIRACIRLLIFGQILSKYGGNILQILSS